MQKLLITSALVFSAMVLTQAVNANIESKESPKVEIDVTGPDDAKKIEELGKEMEKAGEETERAGKEMEKADESMEKAERSLEEAEKEMGK